MATTTFKPKVSRSTQSDLKQLRDRLKNTENAESAKSSFINAPRNNWKAMTESESPLDQIDAEGLEYYLPEMNEEVVDLSPTEQFAPLTEQEYVQSWIEGFMFAGPTARGIEPQTRESMKIPDVQQLIIKNEAFAKSPWILLEHTKEQYKLIKSLIRLKKKALKGGVTLEESVLLEADLTYLYKCEHRVLREMDTAEVYARQRRAEIDAANA